MSHWRCHCRTSIVALGLALASATTSANAPELVEAVRRGDEPAVRALIEQGADVNSPAGDLTALHWAVRNGNARLVDLLLARGAKVNTANDLGVTPLMLACTNRDAALVSRLIAAGGDARAAQITGETVLMSCSRTGTAPAVMALAKAGADVNAAEQLQGQTALMWAAANGDAATVTALIDAGAKVSARSIPQPETVRDPKAPPRPRGARVATVTYLKGGFTPILFAARNGHVDATRVLLARGADKNDASADGMPLLTLAAQSGQTDVAAFLLKEGADPNNSAIGYTALHAAVLLGDRRLVEALLAAGADPNALVQQGNPERRFAYQWDISASLAGATPFFMAAKFGEPEIMRLLAHGGADPLRPVGIGGSAEVVRGVARGTTPLMAAAGVGWRVPTNVTAGTDRRGRTLPRDQTFAEWEDEDRTVEVVRVALSYSPDVNAINFEGDTAAHGAARLGLKRVVALLEQHGADMTFLNRAAESPETLLVKSANRPPR